MTTAAAVGSVLHFQRPVAVRSPADLSIEVIEVVRLLKVTRKGNRVVVVATRTKKKRKRVRGVILVPTSSYVAGRTRALVSGDRPQTDLESIAEACNAGRSAHLSDLVVLKRSELAEQLR